MTMTLESAIKHCEEVAEENEKFCFKKNGKGGYFNEDTDWNNKKCAKEHRQLAGWLKELKQLRIQTRWIPCSERLPEEGQGVMVPFGDKIAVCLAQDNDGTLREVTSLISKNAPEIWLYPEPEWGDGYAAWMPLPEPMKVGE